MEHSHPRERLHSAQEWLLECREEITHDDPVAAVRVGFYSTLQSLQSALLFENLPEDLPISTLVSETARLLTGYLTRTWECVKAALTLQRQLTTASTPAPPPHPASHRAHSENPGCS